MSHGTSKDVGEHPVELCGAKRSVHHAWSRATCVADPPSVDMRRKARPAGIDLCEGGGSNTVEAPHRAPEPPNPR